MKKLLSLIFSIFLFGHQCMASQLYLIKNPSRNDVLRVIEKSFRSKSYTLTQRNPYYGKSEKYGTAIILLQDDVTGLYYYFDGSEKLNKQILKGFKDLKLSFTQINTGLKDSFDNMAQEQIFGKKIQYVFNNESQPFIPDSNNYNEQTNYQPTNSSQPIINNQIAQTNVSSNVLQGYIGQLGVGTEIPAYLQSPINTETARKGNKITLILSKDLVYNNTVVAPQGSLVFGTIIKANSATYGQRNGQIQIDFNTLQLPSGQVYNMSTERIDFKVEGNEGKANIAGKIIAGAATTALLTLAFAALGHSSHIGRSVAIGAGVGAATVGVIEGSKKGVNAEIPAYTEINLILTKPLSVKMN